MLMHQTRMAVADGLIALIICDHLQGTSSQCCLCANVDTPNTAGSQSGEQCNYLAGRDDVLHSCVGVVAGGSSNDCRKSDTWPALDGPWLRGGGRGLPNGRCDTGGISNSDGPGTVDIGCSGSEASGRLLVDRPWWKFYTAIAWGTRDTTHHSTQWKQWQQQTWQCPLWALEHFQTTEMWLIN